MTELSSLATELASQLDAGTLQQSELADGSGVIIDIAGRKVLSLNATGMLLMQELVKHQSEESLHHILTEQFSLSEEQAKADTQQFLKDLDTAIHQR